MGFSLRSCVALVLLLAGANPALAAESEWVYRGTTGRLIYAPDAQGDRVLDFSDVGYRAGSVPLPTVATAVTVQPVAGDDTASIQAAINQVSSLPLGPDGFRGAVELAAGTYEIGTQLQIRSSGVVLRGSGRDAGGTLLIGTGTTQRDLIQVFGSGSQSLTGSTRNLIDKTVPVGATSFRVDSTAGFAVGDTVRIERPSTANWISDLGMDMIPPRNDGGTVNQWNPGSFNLRYDRVITRIEGERVFIDAPLANAFEQQYGGGTIRKYNWSDRIENVGVENLRAESTFTSATDEDHAWNFVSIDSAQNVWVRDTTSAHFGRSAVLSNPGSKWVTVDNAINLTPKSRITGSRRYTFDLSGELELVTNSEANEGRHDFVNNSSRPPGPHVFHRSVANNALDEAGPHQRWATGSLFDNIVVDGDQINARNRGNFGTGHGWAGANMVIWNSTADSFIVQNPPTAQNWLIGSTGTVIDDQTFGPQPPGYIDSHGVPVEIESLYEAQVEDAAQVSRFAWGGGSGLWTDAESWRERLTPGTYSVESREYLIGDIDDFTQDGASSVDNAPVDPAWRSAIEGSSSLPITGFDDASGNENVAFTISHLLDPGERVVHGSLALSLKQSGGAIDTDDFVRLFDTAPEHQLSFADLGWANQINPSEAFVGVLDLGFFTDELQGGSVNVQVTEDVAVDWALYTITVATPHGSSGEASVTIAGGGEAIVAEDVGAVASLEVGGATAGVLRVEDLGALMVQDNYDQSPNGVLQVEIGPHGGGGLQVLGDATLAGELDLLLADGYTPAFGEAFELLSVDGVLNGAFASISLPVLSDGLRFRLSQADGSLLASVILAGDYNEDGRVDAADYTVWRDTLGSTTALGADGNQDGVVNTADLDVWRDAFERSAVGSTASTPEPMSGWLAVGSFLLAALRPHRRAAC